MSFLISLLRLRAVPQSTHLLSWGIELPIYADLSYLRVCIIFTSNVTNEVDVGSRSATVRLKLGPTDSRQWEGQSGCSWGRHCSPAADGVQLVYNLNENVRGKLDVLCCLLNTCLDTLHYGWPCFVLAVGA